MAFIATIPRQRTELLTSWVGALIASLSDHFAWLSATARAVHGAPNLLSQQQLTHCTMVRFRPAGRLTFFAYGSPPGAKKVSKETHPGIRVSLRSTSLPPVPLRGPAYKGHPWPFMRGRLVLSPHPCGSLPYATPTLGLLTGSLRACRFPVSSHSELSVYLFVERVQPAQPAYAGFTRPTRSFPRSAWACSHRRSASAGRRASLGGFPRRAWEPSKKVRAGIRSRQEAEWNR